MRQVAREHSVSLRGHRGTQLGDHDVPDLILGLEQHHVDDARRTYPDLPADAIRLLHTEGIADPYGLNLAAYRKCADQIASAIDVIDL